MIIELMLSRLIISIIILLVVFFMFFTNMFFTKKNANTGFIRRKSESDINLNIPIMFSQLEEWISNLDEALIYQRDFTFMLENYTYVIPYTALSNAHWLYNFKANVSSRSYKIDLKLKSGINYSGSAQNLTFDEFKNLVHQLAFALKNKNDLSCLLRNQQISIPIDVIQSGTYRFEYEYEEKAQGKKKYELEFHIQSRV